MKQHLAENELVVEGVGASVIQNGFTAEPAEAHGTYTVKCTGPLEKDRPAYSKLHEQLAYLEGNHPLGSVPKFERFMQKVAYLANPFNTVPGLKTIKAKALKHAMAAFPMEIKWEDTCENVVCTEGKNVMLDAALAGSAYTVVGPYMGLISSVSYTAVAAGDTAAQINGSNGWKEAGSASNFPLYTTPRKTMVFSAASAGAKALSASLTFAIITTGGTVKGCFAVFFTSASSTIASTTGALYSAGLFTGGDKVVAVSDSLAVSYSTSL